MKHLLRLLRPKQWLKNLLVFAGIAFGQYFDSQTIISVMIVFVAFCCAASAVYVINDIKDKEADKHHPKKKNRPLASGKVKQWQAWFLFCVMIIGLAISLYYLSVPARIIILSYVVMNVLYSYLLKNVMLIDVFVIATGFLLRILAGTTGIGITSSSWLITTVTSLALFLGFCKRANELTISGKKHRAVLAQYNPEILQSFIGICATLSIMFYALYITEKHEGTLFYISIVPVILGMFQYLWLVKQGRGGDPIEEALKDPFLATTLLLWGLCLAGGFFL